VSATHKYIPLPALKTCLYYVVVEGPINYNGAELYKTLRKRNRVILMLMRIVFWLIGFIVIKWITNFFGRFIDYMTLSVHSDETTTEKVTKLCGNVKRSDKYRQHNEAVLHKWKKSLALLSMMTTHGRKQKNNS